MRLARPLSQGFTYAIGQSLYVPLTSRCNSLTLPSTRGPNFMLDAEVVAALCRVRDAEADEVKWEAWCRYLDMQETPQKLPAPLPKIAYASDCHSIRPEVDELVAQVEEHLDRRWTSIVIAGEGEPLLRPVVLHELIRRIRTLTDIDLRLSTNGLLAEADTARTLLEAGLTSLSVALMTYDQHQYVKLMEPEWDKKEPAHARVCDFVRKAVDCGLQVEVTGVKRDDVDREGLETLARNLGVGKVRWRTYFP